LRRWAEAAAWKTGCVVEGSWTRKIRQKRGRLVRGETVSRESSGGRAKKTSPKPSKRGLDFYKDLLVSRSE